MSAAGQRPAPLRAGVDSVANAVAAPDRPCAYACSNLVGAVIFVAGAYRYLYLQGKPEPLAETATTPIAGQAAGRALTPRVARRGVQLNAVVGVEPRLNGYETATRACVAVSYA